MTIFIFHGLWTPREKINSDFKQEAVSHVHVSHVETVTAATAGTYDCSAGFSRWRDGWSLAKKNWPMDSAGGKTGFKTMKDLVF